MTTRPPTLARSGWSWNAKGTPIGGYDILVAGHARSRGLVVVTRNTREFRRVDGLRVADWVGGT